MKDQMTGSKVQFFHSQSSFDSSSIMSNSRVHDLAQQLTDDTQSIFINMKQTLVPLQNLVKIQNVEHIIHRAKLLSKQTIPLNLNKLERQNSSNAFSEVRQNRKRLEKLISDYNLYKTQNMNYQQFYQLYGRQVQMNFFKNKNQMNINLYPDHVVQVVQTHSNKNLKANRNSSNLSYRQHPRQRQVYQLKDQIFRLKKKQRQILRQKQTQISQIKTQSQKRINTILKMVRNKSQSQQIQTLRLNLTQTQKNLIQQRQKNELQRQKIITLQNQLQQITNKHGILQKQAIQNRKIQLNNSRLSDANSHLNLQIQSQNNDNLPKRPTITKLQKIIYNLNQQKNLLKTQLNKQRQFVYRMKKNDQVDIQAQLYHTRRGLQKKTKQVSDLKKQLDKNKIQSIKMTDMYQKALKQLNFKKLIVSNAQLNQKSNNAQILKPLNQNIISVARFCVQNFKPQAIEGNKYYQLLNKQFKIRYRRSCLRSKQLLYKANGLQLGVITQYKPPNNFKIITHLTDFGQEDIQNMKLKIINTNDNITNIDNQQIRILKPGEQKKVQINVQIKNYPTGATILVCDYQFYGKKQQLRILLPAHIFKMMTIKPKDGQFISPTKFQLRGERKILKDKDSLINYFSGGKVQDGVIKCSLTHQHTDTKFLMELFQKDGRISITYEHRAGQKKITQYYISSLKNILQKEH